MGDVRIHTQHGNDHDRAYDEIISSSSVSVTMVTSKLDDAFNALPKKVREDSTSKKNIAALKEQIADCAEPPQLAMGWGELAYTRYGRRLAYRH